MPNNKVFNNTHKLCASVSLSVLFILCTTKAISSENAEEKSASGVDKLISTAETPFYQTILPNGTIQFSDTPTARSTPVVMGQQRLNSMPSLTQNLVTAQQPQTQVAHVKNTLMHRLELVTPANQATVRNNNGTVEVNLSLPPALVQNTQLVFTVNVSNILTFTANKPRFNIENIPRGTHTIFVQAHDKNGKLIAKSLTNTFFMHRARVK